MTPEPMSDEQFKNARLAVQEAWNHWNTHEYIRDRLYDLLHECERLRALQPAIPPDVLAAMERYRAKPPLLSSDEWWQERRAAGELIARHFVSHFGKDGT